MAAIPGFHWLRYRSNGFDLPTEPIGERSGRDSRPLASQHRGFWARPRLPGALARAPLVASLPPFNCYEVGFCKRQRKACASRVRIESSRIHTAARVRVTPLSYWAGVAGGGSRLASLRTSFFSPVRLWDTFRLRKIIHF